MITAWLKYVSVFALVLVIFSMNLVARAEPTTVVKSKYSFSIQLPQDFVIATETVDDEDFHLYRVYKDAKCYLGIYVGNFPREFPDDIEATEISQLEICVPDDKLPRGPSTRNHSQVKIRSWWADEKLVQRFFLAYLNEPKDWPAFVCAWTAPGLAEDEIQVADRILFSLQVKRPQPVER